MRTAILDGDVFAFQSAVVHEREVQWDTWLWGLWTNTDDAIATLDEAIRRVCVGMKADRVVIGLSSKNNWRLDVLPTYKHHRVGTRKPCGYAHVLQYMRDTYETWEWPTLEGDDVISILATHPTLLPGQKVIVSIDKDMKSVPGYLLNDGKARKAMEEGQEYDDFITEISSTEADLNHLRQTLTGDTTDGYKGCPGVGPVKAEKILEPYLDNPKAAWPAIVEAYQKAGLSEEVALQNARVARILRASDFNLDTETVKLWKPSSPAKAASVTTPPAVEAPENAPTKARRRKPAK